MKRRIRKIITFVYRSIIYTQKHLQADWLTACQFISNVVQKCEWGGGSTKKNSRKGKLNEKNSCTPINPKIYSCYGLKKIDTRNLITKKNSCGSKIPHPPHNFSNGLSLRRSWQHEITKPLKFLHVNYL